MNIFFSYIRVFVSLACTLAGIQVPVFVDQYGKSLESHLIESRNALDKFQDDADKYFDGSLENLIAHYKNNEDQVFNEGGDSIQSIYDRNLMLRKRFEQFQSSPWAAYTQALVSPVPEVRKEVWENFSYAVQLKPNSIAFGLISGLVITLLIELLLRALVFKVPKMLNQ